MRTDGSNMDDRGKPILEVLQGSSTNLAVATPSSAPTGPLEKTLVESVQNCLSPVKVTATNPSQKKFVSSAKYCDTVRVNL